MKFLSDILERRLPTISVSVLPLLLQISFVLVLLSFFSAAYTLHLYSYSQHGSIYSGLYSCSLGYVREFLLLFLHWFPLNLIILKVDVTVFLVLIVYK